MLRRVIKGNEGKMGTASDRLRANAARLSNDEKFRQAMDKINKEKLNKGFMKLIDAIKRSIKERERVAMEAIKQERDDAIRREELARIQAEKARRLMAKLLRDMLRSFQSQRGAAFTKLLNNNNDRKLFDETNKISLGLRKKNAQIGKDGLCRKLVAQQRRKADDALRTLIDILRQSEAADRERLIQEKRIKDTIRRMFARLAGAQKAKEAQIFTDL